MSDQGDADRLVAIRERRKKAPPGRWFVNDRTGLVCHGDPDDDRENYPLDDPDADEFLAASSEDVPWLCDRLLESWGIIADMMQDGGYQRGVLEGLRLAGELAAKMAEDVEYNLGQVGHAKRTAEKMAARIADLDSAVSPLPPEALLRRYEEMKAALRRITELGVVWDSHADVGNVLQHVQKIVLEALGEKTPPTTFESTPCCADSISSTSPG